MEDSTTAVKYFLPLSSFRHKNIKRLLHVRGRVRLPFIVALRSSEEQKERTPAASPSPSDSLLSDVTTDGETAAGPIQENFKPDSLGSRGDLNKSDRIRHRHQILNWKFRNPYIFPSWAQQWNRIDCQNVCFLCNLYAYMCSTHKSLSQMVKKD